MRAPLAVARVLPSLAALPLTLTLACAGTVSGPTDGEAASTTSAVVAIERITDPAQGSRAEASARFLRVTGPAGTEDALRAVGASLDLPAPGTCASGYRTASVSPVPVIELFDVGAVTVEAAGVETRLSPRQLPDVTDVVSGVVYDRAADPAVLPAGAGYTLRVAGAPGFEPFAIGATAPGEPGEVRVAGEDSASAVSVAASAASIELSWAPAASTSGDDSIYVEVRPGSVRCTLAEGGRGSVATSFLGESGTLVIHRLHREALHVRGIDSGEVRFDFARSVSYVRR